MIPGPSTHFFNFHSAQLHNVKKLFLMAATSEMQLRATDATQATIRQMQPILYNGVYSLPTPPDVLVDRNLIIAVNICVVLSAL